MCLTNIIPPIVHARQDRPFIAKAKNGEYIGAFAAYGYKKSKADKHILETNEEVAGNVVWMFEMAAYQGYGYNKISSVLKEHKILTPAAYQAQQCGRPYDKDPYDWNLASVHKMLNDKTYLGMLISGRRRKQSFKSKRVIRKDEDEWIVIPGVVPQLVSQQLWDDAHSKLDSRKRTTTKGKENIFAGLIKCDKCGHALGVANAANRDGYYMCNTYKKKGATMCSSHYILYRELYQAVLQDMNEVLQMVREDKSSFIKRVLHKVDNVSDHEEERIEREMQTLTERIEELDRKFDTLYDDRFNGIISDKKFKELAQKCDSEQDMAKAQLEILQKNKTKIRTTDLGAAKFVELAEQYETLTELDSDVLNRMIDSIVIGDRVKVGKTNEQTIKINYRFIGEVA